jgi:hypothetical protein
MNNSNPFSNLNFAVRPRRIPARPVAVGAAFLTFTGLWLIVPHSVLYWLLLPVVLGLTWAASYGWRPAVFALVEILTSLLQL